MDQPKLNTTAFSNTTRGNKFSVWAEHLDPIQIKGQEGEQTFIKILPAFQYDENNAPIPGSVASTRYSDGSMAPWGTTVYIANYVGYGSPKAGGRRRDFLGGQTFGEGSRCLLTEVCNAAYANLDRWAYIVGMVVDTEKSTETVTKYKSADYQSGLRLLQRPKANLALNAVECAKPNAGVQLMYMGLSAAKSMFDSEGVVYKANYHATEEQLAINVNNGYDSGDFTNLQSGVAINIERDNNADGSVNGYTVKIAAQAKVAGGRLEPVVYPLPDDVLGFRQDLQNPQSLLKPVDEASVMEDLIYILNRWAPDGSSHPYMLLKELFGAEFNIPEPPAKPFTQAPAQSTNYQAPSATQFATPNATQGAVVKPAAPVIMQAATAPPATGGISTASYGSAPKVDDVPCDLRPMTPPVAPVNTGKLPAGTPGGPAPAGKEAFMAKLANE
jgi:hypothetical protein